jgi:hypothetical protein
LVVHVYQESLEHVRRVSYWPSNVDIDRTPSSWTIIHPTDIKGTFSQSWLEEVFNVYRARKVDKVDVFIPLSFKDRFSTYANSIKSCDELKMSAIVIHNKMIEDLRREKQWSHAYSAGLMTLMCNYIVNDAINVTQSAYVGLMNGVFNNDSTDQRRVLNHGVQAVNEMSWWAYMLKMLIDSVKSIPHLLEKIFSAVGNMFNNNKLGGIMDDIKVLSKRV